MILSMTAIVAVFAVHCSTTLGLGSSHR